jgi:hypothetical protein
MGDMGSIRLHKQYGLNPTMSVCIICGKETGEIALLGAAYKGEAPHRMVTGVEPCGECRDKYLKEGVLLLEATMEQHGGKQIPKPTGGLLVIKLEAFKRMCNVAVPPGHITYVEPGVLARITSMANPKEGSGESGTA